MRTAVACERCRKSKVKCHHSGDSPCRGCLKSGNSASCVLTSTGAATATTALSRTHPSRVPRREKQRAISPDSPSSSKPTAKKRKRRRCDATTATVAGAAVCASDELARHLAGIDAGLLARAVATLRVQFPECGFLHPSDLAGDAPHDDDERLRLVAVLAVSCRYLGAAADARRAEHAALLTRELQRRVTAPPSLGLIQCFLIMALYEWGEGVGYSAWMYAGIAARMAQVYRATKTETSERDAKVMSSSSPSSLSNAGPVLSEVEIRTMWTYFAIDKLLSCGKQRPAMMKPEDIEVRMPQSEEDFVYGSAAPPRALLSFEDLARDPALCRRMSGPGFQFCILVRGLDVWHKMHSWIVDGGRKQPRMTEPEHCPWNPTSQWAKLREQLMRWREDQDSRLKYPETTVAAHAHFGRGEVFAYINLIYYLCTIFLRREYIPLLPIAEREPRGPIDPPFYSEEAPPGWWRQNNDELFAAAAQISYIMRDLNGLDIALHTPFTALCVFTAALMNRYAVTFPHMHRPEERELRRRLGAENLADLEKIARLWPLGAEWVQVIGAAQNLYDRLMSNRAEAAGARHCQCEYPELVNSVHYAPLGGIYSDKRETSRCRCPDTRHKTASREKENGPAEQSQDDMPCDQSAPDPFTGYDADVTGDDWRLWSFWDDPHLLSWDTSTIGI